MPLIPQRAKTRQETKPRRRPAVSPGVPCVKQGTKLATYTQGPIYAPIPACPATRPTGHLFMGYTWALFFTRQKGPHAGGPFFQPCLLDKEDT